MAFDNPKQLLDWADSNIRELDVIRTALFQDLKSEMITELEPETGNKIYKLRLNGGLPPEARRLITEAVVHCRHSLDQACVATWESLDLGPAPKNLYFPFATNSNDLEGRLRSTPGDKLAPIHDVIRAAQPYPATQGQKDGNYMLIVLNDAAQRKHRLVPKIHAKIIGSHFENGTFYGLARPLVFPPQWDADKGEMLIGVTAPQGHIEVNVNLSIYVSTDGGGELDNWPVVSCLEAISAECRRIVNAIEGALN